MRLYTLPPVQSLQELQNTLKHAGVGMCSMYVLAACAGPELGTKIRAMLGDINQQSQAATELVQPRLQIPIVLGKPW